MTDWQATVREHSGIIWQTVYRLLGDHHEASDCFQETFLAALEVSRRERVRHWAALLVRLATNRALDRLRRRMRRLAREDGVQDWLAVPARNPGPAQEAEASELADRLRQALAQLPPQQGEVFCLRYLNELSYRDIARELGLKTSAVGVLLHRARLRLGELLGETGKVSNAEVSQ